MSNIVIRGINGPVVTVTGGHTLSMMETVYVGEQKLIGEVVGVQEDLATVQVYEDTSGLKPGSPVTATGQPLSIRLGPGLLSNIFDGIARPLKALEAATGAFLDRGLDVPSLDEDKRWPMTITVQEGDVLTSGMVFATCPETSVITHKCMVPPGISGTVLSKVSDGSYRVSDTLVTIQNEKGQEISLTAAQNWPIRTPRPTKARLMADTPLITGQRVIDTLFPIAKGGCAAIPGPFGAGKTITQHQLAKWSDADVIVYLGCGERGNEMTQVLEEFSDLHDPRNNQPLMNRTILIANTSNMPVAAREASIYTGMTIAEYYRDMGLNVALMADSTSRWAEALREISGRLEEMPAEEGFPAYLPSRLAEFYERAGHMNVLSGGEGSVTVIGAVSPQGGDFSEPVTQNTKRFIRCFWALDRSLAYARHFPSINWMTSWSEYGVDLTKWYESHLGSSFLALRDKIMSLLQEENKLQEIVKLIGEDILPDDQRLVLAVARVIRVGFLQQNAYHDTDSYVPMEKQLKMMECICHLYTKSQELIPYRIPIARLLETGLFDDLTRIKYDVPNDQLSMIDSYIEKIDKTVSSVISTQQ